MTDATTKLPEEETAQKIVDNTFAAWRKEEEDWTYLDAAEEAIQKGVTIADFADENPLRDGFADWIIGIYVTDWEDDSEDTEYAYDGEEDREEYYEQLEKMNSYYDDKIRRVEENRQLYASLYIIGEACSKMDGDDAVVAEIVSANLDSLNLSKAERENALDFLLYSPWWTWHWDDENIVQSIK